MTLTFSASEHEELKPRITVFGVGGAGGNAVNNMIEQQLDPLLFGHAHGEVGAHGRDVIEAEGVKLLVAEERHQEAADVGGLVHGDRLSVLPIRCWP